MFSRFQNGPWGILCRWVSPRVSASAPHEQIQPQYAPLPQNQMIAGISTKVWAMPMPIHHHSGSAVNQLNTASGQARIRP